VKQRQKGSQKGQMARVSVRDIGQIDGRLRASKAMVQWRSELERDLGGDLSAQQRTLVELCCRNRLLLDSLDLFLMGLPSLVNRRKRAALPALATRMQLSESLARLLMQLGLERRMPAAPDLQTYLAKKYGGDEGSDTGHEVEPDEPQESTQGETE
jgi:hypothetical protein